MVMTAWYQVVFSLSIRPNQTNIPEAGYSEPQMPFEIAVCQNNGRTIEKANEGMEVTKEILNEALSV